MMQPRARTPGLMASRTVWTLVGLAWAALASVNAGAGEGPVDHSDHQPTANAALDHEGHQEQGSAATAEDPHAHHRAMMNKRSYQRSEHGYRLPDLQLIRMDGDETTLLTEVNCGRPVMLNFIFTTCTTICPVMSASFARVQQELGPERDHVRMISISIDPEHDRPERLREYAKRFDAGPQWDFYTGDVGDIIAVQKAFDVYRGSKMSHEPTTLMRKSAADPWIRIDGLASAGDIVKEYQQLIVH